MSRLLEAASYKVVLFAHSPVCFLLLTPFLFLFPFLSLPLSPSLSLFLSGNLVRERRSAPGAASTVTTCVSLCRDSTRKYDESNFQQTPDLAQDHVALRRGLVFRVSACIGVLDLKWSSADLRRLCRSVSALYNSCYSERYFSPMSYSSLSRVLLYVQKEVCQMLAC